MDQKKEHKGIIGKSYEDDFPVIWRFVNESPSTEKRKQLPWLTVISWKYDGADNNGMPEATVNEKMLSLEDALTEQVEKSDFCEHAYSRTGNNLKEFVYYISDRDLFIERLNKALKAHQSYPIEIDFYEDPDWKEFYNLVNDFDK